MLLDYGKLIGAGWCTQHRCFQVRQGSCLVTPSTEAVACIEPELVQTLPIGRGGPHENDGGCEALSRIREGLHAVENLAQRRLLQPMRIVIPELQESVDAFWCPAKDESEGDQQDLNARGPNARVQSVSIVCKRRENRMCGWHGASTLQAANLSSEAAEVQLLPAVAGAGMQQCCKLAEGNSGADRHHNHR